MIPSVASSLGECIAAILYAEHEEQVVPLLRTLRFPAGDTLTTLPSSTGNTVPSTWNSPLPERKKKFSWLLWLCRILVSVPGGMTERKLASCSSESGAAEYFFPGIFTSGPSWSSYSFSSFNLPTPIAAKFCSTAIFPIFHLSNILKWLFIQLFKCYAFSVFRYNQSAHIRPVMASFVAKDGTGGLAMIDGIHVYGNQLDVGECVTSPLLPVHWDDKPSVLENSGNTHRHCSPQYN